jgi:hypothetical protein
MKTSARRKLATIAGTVLVIAGCSNAERGASEITTPPVETSTAVPTEGVAESSTSTRPTSETDSPLRTSNSGLTQRRARTSQSKLCFRSSHTPTEFRTDVDTSA